MSGPSTRAEPPGSSATAPRNTSGSGPCEPETRGAAWTDERATSERGPSSASRRRARNTAPPRGRLTRGQLPSGQVGNRADLHAAKGSGHLPRDRERLVKVGGLDDVVAAESLFRLGERTVGDHESAVPAAAHRGRRGRRGQGAPAAQVPGVGGLERVVIVHDLVRGLLVQLRPPGFLLVDQEQALGHGNLLISLLPYADTR